MDRLTRVFSLRLAVLLGMAAAGIPALSASGGDTGRPDQSAAQSSVARLPAGPNFQPPVLLPAAQPAERSEQLEKTARLADRQIAHGFDLANRGAYYAARAEFVAALRLVAQGLDAEQHATSHSHCLSAGLTAMKEAQDFLPTAGKLESDLDLPAIIASHRTPVLKCATPDNLLPLTALKSYFTFSQEQLSQAAGHEVAGSLALYALGKLHSTVAKQKSHDLVAAEPKAVVFFQASLVVFPKNYMAANDLGVLLAQGGSYAEARKALEHSVMTMRQSASVYNLSVVYRQLGQPRVADQLRQEADALHRTEVARLNARQTSADGMVQWMDPRAFAQTNVQGANPPTTMPVQQNTTAARQSGDTRK